MEFWLPAQSSAQVFNSTKFELQCDPKNDYHLVLRGQAWDPWMAKRHTVAETYWDPEALLPRVPCSDYWRTGPKACAASFDSVAFRDAVTRDHCDKVLDNGFQRAYAVPPRNSRLEGLPHLPVDSGFNQKRFLPAAAGLPPPPHPSPFPYTYPFDLDGKLIAVTTPDLMQLLGFHGPGHVAVNIGANDGATSDPVVGLYHAGWTGIAVELEARFCPVLASVVHKQHTNVGVMCPVKATPENTPRMLHDHNVAKDFAYLKIDIDSYDCDVLQAILADGFRPAVIQMETGAIPPPIKFNVQYTPEYARPHAQIYQAFGCSLSYTNDLIARVAHDGGYKLIQAGLDSIWIRGDVIARSPVHVWVQPDETTAFVNGFWRWPWRRELHIWEIGTEHWFQFQSDIPRLAAVQEHMRCVQDCFHEADPGTGRAPSFLYTLSR